MATRIALIGPGAVGGCIAARLHAREDTDVSLVARTPFPELILERPEGDAIRFIPTFLRAPHPPPIAFDWVLVATKAYDATSTAPWLNALVGPTTRVAILQNGVEHRERFAGLVPPDQLLAVMVDLPAERSEFGALRQRGPAVLRVPNDELGRAFVALFAGTGVDAKTSDDFLSVLWRKLAINAPGAVNALLLMPNRIAHDPAIAELMRGIILEVITVGYAEGAKLDVPLADKILASMRRSAPDGVNSLHADRAAGRPMEVDARNGAVVRAGERHGIPTPLNHMAATLLGALQPQR